MRLLKVVGLLSVVMATTVAQSPMPSPSVSPRPPITQMTSSPLLQKSPPPHHSSSPPPPPHHNSSPPPSHHNSSPPPSHHNSSPPPSHHQTSTIRKNIKPTSTSSIPEPTTTVARAVQGNWAEWEAWGTCSVDCGNGTKTRTRTCTNPPPSGGGRDCIGDATDRQECLNKPCAKLNVKVVVTLAGGAEWNVKLNDTNSKEHKEYKAQIIYWGEEKFGNRKDFQEITNIRFVQGSAVIANFLVIFLASSSPSDQPNYQDAIKTAISSGSIGNLTVDASSLKTEEKVDGVRVGDWKTDLNLCSDRCCNSMSNKVYQNRSCEALISSCSGVQLAKEIDCVGGGCTKSHCSDGIILQISAITMFLCVLISLRFMQ